MTSNANCTNQRGAGRMRPWALFLVLTWAGLAMAQAWAAPGSDGRKEIVFWHYVGGPLGADFEQIVAGFNASQSTHRIKPVLVPLLTPSMGDHKFLAALAGGVPPDVIMIDRPQAPKWVLRDAFQDLTPYVRREGYSEREFFSVPWDEVQYDGRFLMMPIWSEIRYLLYNRELFRQAGLDPERPPQSWDELRAYSRRLTTRDSAGRIGQLGFLGANNILILLGWQAGGDLVDDSRRHAAVATAPYRRGLEFYAGLIGDFGRDNYLRFISTGGGDLESHDPFLNGRVAMKLGLGYYYTRLRQIAPRLDCRIAPFPMPEAGGQPISWLSGFGLAIPRGVEDVAGAWSFIRYMSTAETQTEFALRMGLLPSRREAAKHPDFYGDPNRKVLVDLIDHCRHYPQVPVISEVYGELDKAVEKTVHQTASPREALALAQVNTQKSLDEYARRQSLPLVRWGRIAWPAILLLLAGVAFLATPTWKICRDDRAERRALMAGYLFAAPWLIGFLLFTAGPVVASLFYSFCDYQVITPARWNGLDNYARMLGRDPLFWKSLWNTLFYTAFSVPLGLVAALLLALLLNQPLKGMRYFRTVFYLPTLVTGVAVSVLWMWVLQPENGIVNRGLAAIGIEGPLWMQSEHWSKPSIVLMGLWGVGGSAMIFLAGLQGIPAQLYEAAELDGAGRWKRLLHVTLPMLSPTVFYVLIVGVIGSFQVFTQAYVISQGSGGPLDSTLFYVFYLYRRGFEDFQMGYASALAWILFSVTFVLTLAQLRMSRKWVHYQG